MRTLGWILGVVLLAALGAGGFLAKRRYDQLMAELAGCSARVAGLEGDVDSTRKERDAEKAGREDSAKKVASAEDTLAATRAELEELRKQRVEADARLAAFNTLTAKLQKMIDTGKLKVVIRGGRMIVKLPAEVLFDSGKAELSQEGEAAIAEVAAALRQFSDRKFMVAGHTDNIPVGPGKFASNWELSTARALVVTEFLIKKGMKPWNLSAAGYAEFDPVANNATPAGRQDNRRIELVLLPKIDELPKLLDETAPAASAVPAASASAGPASLGR